MRLQQGHIDMSGPHDAHVSRMRRNCLATTTLVPLLWATGCAGTKPLVLVGHPWPGYEPMFLARALAYMPPDLTLREAPTMSATIEDIKNGLADGAMLTLDEVLRFRAGGTPLEIALVFDVSKGADVLLSRPGISRLGALRGKRIGVEDSALGTLMLSMALEKAGLRLDDVTIRRINYETQVAAWGHGDIDALVTYEPVAGQLKARGARQLLSTRELPDMIIDVLALRPATARAQAATLRATLAGHFRALRYMRQNPWDAAYRVAPRLGISAEEMIASLRGLQLPDLLGNQRYLSDKEGELLKVVQKLSPTMQQAGLIDAPVDTRGLFTSAYLPGEQA